MSRDFITPAQRLSFDKITPWLHEIFGEDVREHPDVPIFGVKMGSAFAMVQVSAWQNDARIVTRAYISSGTELTPDLLEDLLRLNDTVPFGAFGIDESGDIFFQHVSLASTCDKLELETTVRTVVSVADETDDALIEKWGGDYALSYMW